MDSQQNKKLAYITGTSRGIGFALAELLLEDGYYVIGMSRTNTITHPNFHFHEIDLSNLAEIESFIFEHPATEVLLINNAGTLGEILPVGRLSNQSIRDVTLLNILAPQILMNLFIQTYSQAVSSGKIINISSGAGKKPIESWAPYCASKSAIDLFSETISAEFSQQNQSNWTIYSIAPGVVDTAMQEHIRSASSEDFAMLQNFISLKEDHQLSTPIAVAKKLIYILKNPDLFKKTIFSLRDLD